MTKTRKYKDGKYKVTNKHGVTTLVQVVKGKVIIIDGFAGGKVSSSLEQLEVGGLKVETA